jgi:hypothetical protein
VEAVVRAARHCHALPARPLGQAVCDAIAQVAGQPLPEDVLAMVGWYATEDPDPPEVENLSEGEGSPRSDALHNAAINCTRGRAALAIARLIAEDGARVARFRPALERMVADPVPAVRVAVADALSMLLRHDRGAAVGLFLRLVDGAPDAALAAPPVWRFLRFGMPTHVAALRAVITRIVRSPEREVATGGAQLACLAALMFPKLRALADECLQGSAPERAAAAVVLADNLQLAEVRGFCSDALVRLFDDPEESVRAATARCFQRMEGDDLGEHRALAEAFVRSAAFAEGGATLLRALQRTTARLTQVACAACERYVQTAGVAMGDMRTRAAAVSYQVSEVVARAYNEATDIGDGDLVGRCLDVIDQLAMARGLGLERVFELHER